MPRSKSLDKIVAFKEKISKEVVLQDTPVVIGALVASTITHTIPFYNEDGVLLGHIPLVDDIQVT